MGFSVYNSGRLASSSKPVFLTYSLSFRIGLVFCLADFIITALLYQLLGTTPDSFFSQNAVIFFLLPFVLMLVIHYFVINKALSPLMMKQYFSHSNSRGKFVFSLIIVNVSFPLTASLLPFPSDFIGIYISIYNIFSFSPSIVQNLNYFLFNGLFLTFFQVTSFTLMMYFALLHSDSDLSYYVLEAKELDKPRETMVKITIIYLFTLLIIGMVSIFLLISLYSVFLNFSLTLFGEDYIFVMMPVVTDFLIIRAFIRIIRKNYKDQFIMITRHENGILDLIIITMITCILLYLIILILQPLVSLPTFFRLLLLFDLLSFFLIVLAVIVIPTIGALLYSIQFLRTPSSDSE